MSVGVLRTVDPRFPASWDEFLALAPGDPFRVVLCDVPLDDEDPVEPEGENGQPSEQVARSRGQHVGLVRGVLAERVVWSTELDPFLDLRALAAYSGLSVRKLRDHLDDPAHPLPCYRVGGKILVRRSEFDAWVARYRKVGNPDVEQIVNDVLKSL